MPGSLAEALDVLAGDPSLTVLAGGTDLLVELNYGRHSPDGVLSLRRVRELRGWRVEGSEVVLGAATTYTELLEPGPAQLMPALAQAARTVGSPQIRNTGTIGGNLGTASPAGDTLPVLAALDARVDVAATSGRRTLPVAELIVGPKRTALRPGELITAVRVPVAAGPQEFLKVGVRNAMVIAITNCALVVDVGRRTVGCALGAVGPVPIRDPATEHWLADQIDWDALTAAAGTGRTPRRAGSEPAAPDPISTGDDPEHRRAVSDEVAREFGRRMAAASRPIDDHRSPAAYRRHAVGVLARRALERVATPGQQLTAAHPRADQAPPDPGSGSAAGIDWIGATGQAGTPSAAGSASADALTDREWAGPAAGPDDRDGHTPRGTPGDVAVNGVPRLIEGTHESDSLLRVLRDELGLPGTKNACEQGECGSCSVLVDGVLVCACLELATATAGCEITTVEGLTAPAAAGTRAGAGAEPGEGLLTDVQRAMVEAGGVQCGFCTPGLVVAIHDLLDHVPAPSPLEVREALAGNLCRCTGYGRILEAVEQVVALRSAAAATTDPRERAS